MTSDEKELAIQTIIGFILDPMQKDRVPVSDRQKANLQDSISRDLDINGWTLQQCKDSETMPAGELILNFPETTHTMFSIYRASKMS